VAIPDTTFAPETMGRTVLLPVHVETALDGTEYPYRRGQMAIDGVISFDMVATFDPAHLRFNGVVQDDAFSEGWMVAVNDQEEGELRVSGTSTGDPLVGPPGPLLFLEFELLGGGDPEIRFTSMRFNDGDAAVTGGSVRVDQ